MGGSVAVHAIEASSPGFLHDLRSDNDMKVDMKPLIDRLVDGGGVKNSARTFASLRHRTTLILSGKQVYIHTSLIKKKLGQSDISRRRYSL